MKILVLSFYFEPDLSAGSFRSTALVNALLERLPPDVSVEVITTAPNRYSTFTVDVPATVQRPRLTIRRIALPAHKSGMVDQSRAFLAYAREVLRLVRREKYGLVYATSSRLMTAVLGSWVARKKHVPLYLDIRDIFLDTIKDVLPRKLALIFRPAVAQLERFAVTRATKINLVSRGFTSYFQDRYPAAEYSFFTNGIDQEFVDASASRFESEIRLEEQSEKRTGSRMPVALYAGNMGEGQGLHAIIPKLAQRMEGRVRFKLIGDGGRRGELETMLAAQGITNVEVLPPMNRQDLIKEYRNADIMFLHLNDYTAFKKVLPSKIFEYAATGKPIWAGVGGYAADFLREYVENVAIFPPCDVVAAIDAFSHIDLDWTPRAEFVSKFSRHSISAAMAADVANVLGRNV